MADEDQPRTIGGIAPRPFGMVPQGEVAIPEKVRVVPRGVSVRQGIVIPEVEFQAIYDDDTR